MFLLFIGIFVLIAAFGGVILRGAPYLPTLRKQADAAIELLDLQPGQTLLELGCGDGKVLLIAAKAGLHVVGIELNPILAAISWLRTRRYRHQVKIIWGDFWLVTWPPVDGVFAFILNPFMSRLDERMRVVGKPLVSFAFQVPNREVDAEKDGVFLYRY
jgi:SAM-dependent methyltransferase